MLFSSVEFLYYFLPIVIALYFIVPNKFKNLILLLSSLFFYFWGEPIYTLIMVVMALSGYIHGLLIDKFRGTKKSKVALVSSLVVGLGALGFFKYSNFFIDNINNIFDSAMSTLALALPIGISFYTFQILSYTIDLYRGRYEVQKNFIDFFTYVALFPQLIAGPIVRYSDVDKELKTRTHSFEKVAYGINRFIVGLSKKILVGDVLAEFCDIVKNTENMSVLFMWAYVIAYAIHIYFDFSGYSDMAIGLGRIFGFNFPENFNYPYVSKSITEFWRRWHMTLGSWFRDYVYIPLGGNRVSKLKWIRNIFVVWFLTGFWHGAGWNFIVWGLMFGVLLLIEKLFLFKFLEKIPKIFSRLYVIFFILISWVIFDAASLTEAIGRIGTLFGAGGVPLISADALYYIRSYIGVFILGLIGCTPLIKNLVLKLKSKEKSNKIVNILEPIVQVSLLVLVTAYLIDGSFSAFIYFRF
ncbi:MAG: MBOAT family protein [Clostridia bacterium]|nr:MBOAT family protein [Clostridia bacterium]